MKWILIYVLIGILLAEVLKHYGKADYNIMINEFPDMEPFIPLLMGILWLPLVIVAIMSIIFDGNEKD